MTARRPDAFVTSIADAMRVRSANVNYVAPRQTESAGATSVSVDLDAWQRAMTDVSEAQHMGKGLPKLGWGTAPAPGKSEHRLRLTPDGAPPAPEARYELLATIHEKIIPQLVMAHVGEQVASEPECPDLRPPPTPEEVAAFAALAVREDVTGALGFVETLASQGVSLEAVLLHLIAPAARLLGDDWNDDLRTFSEVTVGLGTLQQVVHVLGPSFASDSGHRGFVVLVAAPMEQHTLGIYLLAEFMRRSGWGVHCEPNMSEGALLDLVRSQRVEMVGISVSNGDLLKPVARLVGSLKDASRNPDLTVMVGGSLHLRDEAESMGALFCSDPRDAVRWLDQRAGRRQEDCSS